MIDDRTRRIRPDAMLALAGICACLLLACLALELHAGLGSVAVPVPAHRRQSARASDAAQDTRAIPPPETIEDATRTALARPLFTPQRRPPSVAVSGPAQPRLSGIILSPRGPKAIFAGAGDVRGTVAAVGQQAGAWKVLAIDAKGVRVSGPDGVHVLKPARDHAPGGGGAGPDAPTDGSPTHPSILDLLRARNGTGGLMGGQVPPAPSPRSGEDAPMQPTAPAAPE